MNPIPSTMRMPRRSYKLCLLSFTALFSVGVLTEAQAQVAPSSVQPGAVEQRFQEPTQQPESAPAMPEVPPAPAAVSPQMLKKHAFELHNVVLDDATVYPQGTFDDLYKNKVGHEVTIEEARVIAGAITDRYRTDGYVLTQAVIPNQSLESGVLHIRVVEGFIDKVTIENSHPESDRRHLIDAYAHKLSSFHPLNVRNLERYMLLINDLPGVRARAVLHPSTTTFGAADLVVEVNDKILEGSFTSDNRGNKFLGPWQEQATLTENSLAGFDERTTLRGINTIPTQNLHYFDVQNEEQLDSEGTRLTLLYSNLLTHPGNSLKPLDLYGSSDDYSLTVSHPFLRSRAENFTGRVTFDARDTENDSLGTVLTNERVRALRVGGNFTAGDRFDGVSLADAQISQGTGWLDATTEGPAARTSTDVEYTKGNLDLSRVQNLPHGFSILTAASGQYSGQAVPVSEQFTLGGVGFGQAYDSGELLGDSGLAGKIELRYGDVVGYKYFDSYQLYSYYDIGSVYINDVGPGVDERMSLASAGVGVRTNINQNLYGYLEVGFPLTRSVASEGDKDPRLFFSVTGRF